MILGVILPSLQACTLPQVLNGMMQAARDHQYYLMFSHSDERYTQEVSNIKKMAACRVDGILLSVSRETTDARVIEEVRHKGIPVVLFGHTPDHFLYNKIIINEYGGAFRIVEHLIQRGCQRIAYMAGPERSQAALCRQKGYMGALKKYGRSPGEERILPALSPPSVNTPPEQLLGGSPLPDGLFVADDLTAAGVLQYLHHHGIRVPEDIRVAGFGNNPFSELSEPSLTTALLPAYEAGKLAITTLIEEIGYRNSPRQTHLLSPTLIIRDSTR